MAGIGNISYDEAYAVKQYSPVAPPGSYFAFAYGAGLDIHITRHFDVRAIDFELQNWPGFAQNGLTPSIISIGAAYRLSR